MSDKVTLTLAHPLSAKQAERLLVDNVKDYAAGDKITVRRDYAMSIINAGFVDGVDPNVPAQVEKALSGPGQSPAATQKSSPGPGK